VPALPNQINAQAVAGSVWDTNYQLLNDDNTPMSITGKSFEFVIRQAVTDTGSPLVSVNSSGPTSMGSITVDTAASSVFVSLTPAATTLLGQGARPYALWMDPGLVTATDLVIGTFNSALAAAP
jgi:hypothetical protein